MMIEFAEKLTTRIDLAQARRMTQADPRPRISVRTSGDEIRVSAELENLTDQPQSYSYSAGSSPTQLLRAYLENSPLVAGPPLPATLPIVTPVYFRFDVPPKSRMVIHADPIRLSEYRYSGAPEAKIVWTMDFVGAQRLGTLRLKLPDRAPSH
jgi:hypothetical protein